MGGLILPSGHVLSSGRQFKRVCLGWGVGLAGRSPVIADEDQKRALADLGQVRDWAETARPLVEPESVRLLGGLSERRRPDVGNPSEHRHDRRRNGSRHGYLGFSVGYNLGSMSPQSPLQIISQPDSIQVLPEAPG